jgi:hypothetical protein
MESSCECGNENRLLKNAEKISSGYTIFNSNQIQELKISKT